MFTVKREQCLRDVVWNADYRGRAGRKALCYYVECWKHESWNDGQPGVNWTEGWLGDADVVDEQLGPCDEHLGMWVRHEGSYSSPVFAPTTGTVQGGICLLLCDRPNMTPGMTISRSSFELVESTWHLHPATLHSFFLVSGTCSNYATYDPQTGAISRISVVIKANQKVEIANYLLSLTHDFGTGWTNALICGDGAIQLRDCDRVYGSQLQQMVDMIKSSTDLWHHPLLVPAILLQNYDQRLEVRTRTLERELIDSEDNLGVTFAGGAGLSVGPQKNWPEHVNVKKTTIRLHSTMAQIIFLGHTCDWALRCGAFILDLDDKLCHDLSSGIDEATSRDLRESIRYVTSSLQSIGGFFLSLLERARTQTNVLYSIISQQDSLINREDNKLNTSIATSAKKDSIAMMTFTFITALFLPGTYTSSLLSMSMFDWQVSPSGTSTHLSSYFWVYWAITIPLTLVTLGGWYAWYTYADTRWRVSLERGLRLSSKPVSSEASNRTGSTF